MAVSKQGSMPNLSVAVAECLRSALDNLLLTATPSPEPQTVALLFGGIPFMLQL